MKTDLHYWYVVTAINRMYCMCTAHFFHWVVDVRFLNATFIAFRKKFFEIMRLCACLRHFRLFTSGKFLCDGHSIVEASKWQYTNLRLFATAGRLLP